MDQIKVELVLIGTGITVDFLLPTQIPLCDLLGEMIMQIQQYDSTVAFEDDQPWYLCDLERNKLLDTYKSIEDLGVQNGSRLSLC